MILLFVSLPLFGVCVDTQKYPKILHNGYNSATEILEFQKL